MRVRLVRGPGAFSQVAGQWADLLGNTQVTRHQQLEEWAHAASAVDGPDDGWLTAEDDAGPLAVLHSAVARRRMGPIRATVLRNGFGDGLLAARCTPSALRTELLRGWAQAGVPVDVLSLNGLRQGSAFHHLAEVTPQKMGQEERFGGYSIVATQAGADDWFADAGKNLRGSLRKAGNRARRHGEIKTVLARTPEEVRAAFEDYCLLEAKGWKASAGALVNRPDERVYLETGLGEAAKAGRARARTLRIGGELAAAQLGVVAGTSLVLLKVTYNEDLAALAPGNLLMAELVRDCCDDPDVERIDLVTNQLWHARWNAVTRPTFQMQAFDVRRPAGLLARTAGAVRSFRSRALPAPEARQA